MTSRAIHARASTSPSPQRTPAPQTASRQPTATRISDSRGRLIGRCVGITVLWSISAQGHAPFDAREDSPLRSHFGWRRYLSAAAITSRERLSTGGDAAICRLGRRGRTSVQPATGVKHFAPSASVLVRGSPRPVTRPPLSSRTRLGSRCSQRRASVPNSTGDCARKTLRKLKTATRVRGIRS